MSKDEEETHVSRREFTAISVAAGIVGTTGTACAAGPVSTRAVKIKTPDGICDAVLVHPEGKTQSAGVIWYPDALGLRPAMVDMAKRLAAHHYAVLVINPFYRLRKAPVFPPSFSLSNPDDRTEVMKMIAELDHHKVSSDADAFTSFLDAQPEVNRRRRLGAVGFCMGGAMTIRAAAIAPDRVGAAVSFHGGKLVTDDATSPHRLVARTKAAYHIGIAADDDEKEPQAKVALRKAFDAAKRPASIKVYPGTKHGWTVTDSPVYDKDQAEHAWAAMLELYKQKLGGTA